MVAASTGDGTASPGESDVAGAPRPDSIDASQLLAEVSRALASEAEADRALLLVMERLIPAVADWGMVRLVEPGGAIRRIGSRHRDLAKTPLIDRLLAANPFDSAAAAQMAPLFTSGRTEVIGDDQDVVRESFRAKPENWELWEALGVRRTAIVPMLAHGEVLGTFLLYIADESRDFPPDHLAVVEAIASRCGLLIANTRLVRESEAVARERTDIDSLFQTVLAHSPVAAVILDHDLRVLLANDAFQAIHGTSAGASLAEAVPALADRLLPLARAALESGRATDRSVVRAAKGFPAPQSYWQASAFPIDRADGDRLGVGIFLSDVSEERRVSRRLADSVTRLDVTLSAGGLATWDWDLLRQEVRWGAGFNEVLGIEDLEADRAPSLGFLERIHPADRDELRRNLIAAVRDHHDVRNEVRVNRADDETQWIEVRGRVLLAADGTPRRMIGVVADVTERRLMEEIRSRLLEREHVARIDAEAARERLAVLAEIGAAMMSSLDARSLLTRLPEVLVPRFADWCAVDLPKEGGGLDEVRIVHADPDRLEDVRALRRWRLAAGGYGLWSVRRSMSSGVSELAVDIDDTDLQGVAVNEEHLATLRRLAPRSAITVPLLAKGEVLGGITVVATGERRFEDDDLALMENAADRVAMALDNARLFEASTQVARALQQTLLPPTMPVIPHCEVEARYRVAADGIEIGGDFYDAFEMQSGTWALVVGDVCGRGAGAAAVTGLFRHTVRAVAKREHGPAAVLRGTNDAILGQIDDTRFCTAVFVALRPEVGAVGDPSVHAAVACGGHPRPIVVRADGSVERVPIAGTLLGVLPEPVLPEVEVALGPGDAMVLYTDGVTEARHGAELFGEGRLIAALEQAAADGASTAAGLADRLEQAVDAFQAGAPGDDVAILVVRVSEAVPPGA